MKMPVLIIAYYWPPAGGPGVQRWLKFAKYLPSLGYDVTVVVPDNPDYPILDESMTDEIPNDISVIKVPINEPSRWLSSLSRKRTKNLQKGILPKDPSLLQQIAIWVRGNFFIPDARVGWKTNVLKAIHPYLLQHKNPTVITTGPPHSIHLVGLELKKKYTGFKWLADFRDPWTTIGYHKHLNIGNRAQKKHERLEKQVLDTADLVVVTSPHTGKEFSSKTSSPIQVITNGYDIQEAQTTRQSQTKFTLSHIGTLLSDRNPKVLWEVLADLCSNDVTFQAQLELRLAGNISEAVLHSLKNYGLTSNLTNLGYLTHAQAVEEMYTAQILLLIEINSEDTKAIIPGKLFEYLASRRPIVALGPANSDIEPIINHTRAGQFFQYSEKENLKEYILKRFEDYRHGNNEGNLDDGIKIYQRKNLTTVLSKTIQHVWE